MTINCKYFLVMSCVALSMHMLEFSLYMYVGVDC